MIPNFLKLNFRSHDIVFRLVFAEIVKNEDSRDVGVKEGGGG